MTDITYTQMESLLNNLVINLDKSTTSVETRSKLDSVIGSLNRIKGQLTTANSNLRNNNGSIDYNKLASKIASAISDNQRSPTRRNRRERREAAAPQPSGSNRRTGSLLDQLYVGAEKQIKDYSKVSSSMDVFHNKISGLSTTISGVEGAMKGLLELSGVKKAFESAKDAIEMRADNYRTMMANGMTFGGDMLEMSRVANSAGMTIKSFTESVANASMGMRQLGPQTFASTLYQVKQANTQFGDLGLTTTETATQLSNYMERLRVSNHLQGRSTSEITSSFRGVIQSSTALAAAVGTSRDAILKASDTLLSDITNKAVLGTLGNGQSQNVQNYVNTLSAAYGGNAQMDKYIKSAMLAATRGVYDENYGEASQAIGGQGMAAMVAEIQKRANTNATISAGDTAEAGNRFNSFMKQYVDPIVRNNAGTSLTPQGRNIEAMFALSNGAVFDRSKADQATQDQEKQTPLTLGALGIEQTREALASLKESLGTLSLSIAQNTIGESLKAWNSAVINSTHTIQKAMTSIGDNPLTTGLDSVGGKIISTLSSLINPVLLVTSVFSGVAMLKALSGLKALGDTIGTIRYGVDTARAGDLMRRYGISRDAADYRVHRRNIARDRLANRTGRRGLLGRLSRNSRPGLLDSLRNNILSRRTARAGRVGRAGRLARLVRPITTGARGLLGLGAEGLTGLVSASGAAISAPIISAIGGIGLGAWWNHRSTQDYRAGRITSAQNNINHDSNYGLMGGAATGAATGALIGAIGGPIGIAIGGALGGIAGGFMGYEAGHGIGSWANSSSPTSPNNPTTTTPGTDPTTTPNNANETNILLQKIIDQLSANSSAIADQDLILTRLLQSIDRNTSDTVTQTKRLSGHL